MCAFTKFFIILVLFMCCDAISKEHQPRQNSKTDITRLDHTVIPINYKIDLTVTQEQILSGSFFGTVQISLRVVENLTTFSIHVKDITIIEITLTGTDYYGTLVAEPNGPDVSDLLKLTSTTTISPGDDYLLTINYAGILSTTDMDGFYRSSYIDYENRVRYLATTQFEAIGARRAFPCFDEPAFKATFDISITHSVTYMALSNTFPLATTEASGTRTTTFQRTPLMSTYIVAFIVSDFVCMDGNPAGDVPTEVCGRLSTLSTMSLALDAAPEILLELNNYTGVNYADMGIAKMTQVAIPDFAVGAMENWGLVTSREDYLLWDPRESSDAFKQTVVTDITHEFAHHWFGNKVTLDWWSDAFLNEGFATYFEYHATANIDRAKDWELTKQFIIEELHVALVQDSVNTSLPLSYEINDMDVISSRFSLISYNKGGSIVRMTHHLLGFDNFKKGLTKYLNLSPIGTTENLWNSLNDYQPSTEPEKLPADLLTVMGNWTYRAGYPCLTVTLDEESGNITISQERFLISGEVEDDTEWYVPITYTTNTSSDFDNTATKAWLIPGENLTLSLDGSQWIILNNQQVGFYRVNYDDRLLEKILTVLSTEDLKKIDELSRSQIVDDQLTLARAGLKDYNTVLGFLPFLKSEDSYYTWSSAFNGFDYLLQRTSNDEIRDALNNYILDQMVGLLESVEGEVVDQISVLKRTLARTWACRLGQEACLADSKMKFDDFYTDPTKRVDRNLRSYVYCYGLRSSDNAVAAFDFLYNQYKISNLATEKTTTLRALGCVSDSEMRIRYLNKALSDEVRLQDAKFVFSSVYSYGPEGVDDVLTFIKDNYTDFEPHFGTKSTLNSLIYTVADLFTTQAQLATLIDFSNNADLEASLKDACEEAVQIAKNNLKTVAQLEETLGTFFGVDTPKLE